MKKNTFFLVVLFCSLSNYTHAQESQKSSGTASSASFFSHIASRQGHSAKKISFEKDFSLLNLNNILAYGNEISPAGSQFVSFGISDPQSISYISSPGADEEEYAGSIDPDNPTIAYVLNQSGGLQTIDITTGSLISYVGYFPPSQDMNWAGMEFDPTTGILYAICTSTTSSSLYHLDISAVTTTFIGATGIDCAIALAVDGNGNIWTYDVVTDNFYSLDATTGEATLIGPIGFDAQYAQGMCWDPNTDTVFMAAFNQTTNLGEWRTVNTSTGETTFINNIGSGYDIVWVSIPSGQNAGVSENPLDDFSFYPNPVQNILHLKSNAPIEKVVFYNTLGQKILEKKNEDIRGDLDVSILVSGVYTMIVSIAEKTGTYKLIKK